MLPLALLKTAQSHPVVRATNMSQRLLKAAPPPPPLPPGGVVFRPRMLAVSFRVPYMHERGL